ncbi:MAG TPA: deoxyribodipyrimidine photo-lyase [Acetobacteraceae bacterium]|nr:deoxyribodipyrimidine photo-lyase [Acetobacteraceae bacterium]
MTDPAAASAAPVMLWFRQDLRLADHPALEAALATGRPVLPVYVLDDTTPGAWRPGGAARWWLHHSLTALAAALAERGAALVLRHGKAAEAIPALAREAGAVAVHATRAHEPFWREADRAVEAALAAQGARLFRHPGTTLFDPGSIRTKAGGVYGLYTPFARACAALPEPSPPAPAPARIPCPKPPRSDSLADWALLPRQPDWAGGLAATWRPGEAEAAARLRAFIAGPAAHYPTGRDRPGEAGTAMLSPALHWGEISPRAVWHAAASLPPEARQRFRAELLWRDFAAYMLFHAPHMPEAPLRPAFARLPWRRDAAALRAWQRGRTGVPIVDAGMRQLWQTGWMHNRARMIAGSFLVKHLLLDWREGQAWFWDTLVDADLASNACNWQWVAGTGIDGQPFFRVFNPVTQGEKFDPDGAYVRRYVPELARLPDRELHAPWQAPPAVLRAAGVELGRTYPAPLVDLAEGRRRALAVYQATVRTEPEAAADAEASARPRGAGEGQAGRAAAGRGRSRNA